MNDGGHIMNIRIIKRMLVLFSLILFSVPLLVFLLWFTFKFQITPFTLISISISTITILLLTTAALIKQRDKKLRVFVFMNIFTILLIILLVYVLPTTVFTEYSKEKIMASYGLEHVIGVHASYPAMNVFPLDNDGSVSIEPIRSYYGGKLIAWIEGVVTTEGELNGKKVLVVYESKKFDPTSTMTVLELDDSYNTEKLGKHQGYESNTYPITDVLIRP